MSKTGKFSTHHIPDQGIWYTPGEMVRLDESARQVQIVKDPDGEYEVHSCRQATEYEATPILLRIGLRKGVIVDPVDPIAPSRLHSR
jgi:hypothetical protein